MCSISSRIVTAVVKLLGYPCVLLSSTIVIWCWCDWLQTNFNYSDLIQSRGKNHSPILSTLHSTVYPPTLILLINLPPPYWVNNRCAPTCLQIPRVFALDFSRAFDTVRHHTLFHKLSTLPLPDKVFEWIKDFFDNRSHCTWFRGELTDITSLKSLPALYKDQQ